MRENPIFLENLVFHNILFYIKIFKYDPICKHYRKWLFIHFTYFDSIDTKIFYRYFKTNASILILIKLIHKKNSATHQKIRIMSPSELYRNAAMGVLVIKPVPLTIFSFNLLAFFSKKNLTFFPIFPQNLESFIQINRS